MQVSSSTTTTSVASTAENKKTSTQNADTQSTNTQSAVLDSSLDKDTISKLSSLGGKGITQIYMAQFMQESMSSVFGNLSGQSSVLNFLNLGSSADGIAKAAQAFSQVDFASIGYTGKNPLSMNSSELNELLGENGFFGVDNTAGRIADFVINGAGDDLEKLQKGFEGMKRGFEEAEKMWGGKLPQISQDTIDKAIEKVSARIDELGGKTLDVNA